MNYGRTFAFVGIGIWLTLAGFGAECQPAGKPLNVADFVDNTEKYKGRTLSLPLTISEGIHGHKGDSLKNYRGRTVSFHGYFGQNQSRFDMKIQIPENLEVPNAGYLDRLTVVFVCDEGNLQQGNVAKSIAR